MFATSRARARAHTLNYTYCLPNKQLLGDLLLLSEAPPLPVSSWTVVLYCDQKVFFFFYFRLTFLLPFDVPDSVNLSSDQVVEHIHPSTQAGAGLSSPVLRSVARQVKHRLYFMSELNKNPVEGFSAGLADEDDIYQWEVVIIGPQDTLL